MTIRQVSSSLTQKNRPANGSHDQQHCPGPMRSEQSSLVAVLSRRVLGWFVMLPCPANHFCWGRDRDAQSTNGELQAEAMRLGQFIFKVKESTKLLTGNAEGAWGETEPGRGGERSSIQKKEAGC